ncbi:fumarylacetoacetate hydrolase family protein [Xanthobacter sp. V2C-8]|uniref:fumarylacetoacetate hydrolase family protein n=1 Tax=Xanthobacter albus TaxID=3119929 RepID=UPI00372AC7BE
MKLGSLKEGGRDGTLVVVDKDLRRMVRATGIARTMQEAIENWDRVAPRLAGLSEALNSGSVSDAVPFDAALMASPFPRAFQFLDGSVYLHHMEKARKARGAAMPPNYKTEPLMYQGLSDHFCGPTDPMPLPDENLELDYEAEVAVVLDEVPMGVSAADASGHIKLIMLLNDYTLRGLTRTELPKGFGFLQAKPTSAFSPVAVTLDELDGAWDGEKLNLRLLSWVNGREMGRADAGKDMFFTYPQLIAHAARTRQLSAGTIMGAGTVSNQDESSGHACLAELRIDEEMESGAPKTSFFCFGDRVRIEMFDASGKSIFGAIDQVIQKG